MLRYAPHASAATTSLRWANIETGTNRGGGSRCPTSIARLSRVKSSTIVRSRNRRPLNSSSAMTDRTFVVRSIDQRSPTRRHDPTCCWQTRYRQNGETPASAGRTYILSMNPIPYEVTEPASLRAEFSLSGHGSGLLRWTCESPVGWGDESEAHDGRPSRPGVRPNSTLRMSAPIPVKRQQHAQSSSRLCQGTCNANAESLPLGLQRDNMN